MYCGNSTIELKDRPGDRPSVCRLDILDVYKRQMQDDRDIMAENTVCAGPAGNLRDGRQKGAL